MSSSMLSFVLEHAPENWEKVDSYNESYILFELDDFSREYKKVAELFTPASTTLIIKSIKRVQQPFQYGRFKLRQEMLRTYSVETVFHLIHPGDTNIALKHTCDYRRYQHCKYRGLQRTAEKQPVFYGNVVEVLDICNKYNEDLRTIFVVCKISGNIKTQSDYFIRYVVEI